jgi:hypothetical protein
MGCDIMRQEVMIMSTATLTIISDDPSLKDLGEREVVLVPLDKYNALLDRLEDLGRDRYAGGPERATPPPG